MKKGLKIGAVVLGIGLVFGAGGFVGANSDWKTVVINDASKQIGQAGYEKKEELLSQDVSGQMKMAANPTIEEEMADLQRMLEEYYQMKLDGLTGTAEFQALEKQIEQIKVNVYERYRKEIDQAFNGQ